MAVVEIKGLKSFQRKLQTRVKASIRKTLRDKSLRKKVGDIVAQDIRDNYKATPKKFTKEMREWLEEFNQTHKDYDRDKINITFTGELLEDLANNIKADTTRLAFVIEHSNKKHKNYKTKGKGLKPRKVQVTSLKTRKTSNVAVKKSYQQISKYIREDHGHDYLKVSTHGQAKIIKLIRNKIFDNIQREFV